MKDQNNKAIEFCTIIYQTISAINIKALILVKELSVFLENPKLLFNKKPVFNDNLIDYLN